MTETMVVNSAVALHQAITQLTAQWSEHKYLEIEVRHRAKQRTWTQSKALHVWCELLATELNNAGYDMTVFPWREGLELPWTKESVKEYLWRPVQQAMTDKKSTTEISTVDPTVIHQALCRTIAERTGVVVPEWPTREGRAA